MKIKPILIICLVFFVSYTSKGQDEFRYTLFDFTGMAMNPALAGNFEGTARAGGIFREQDHGLVIGQYRNPVGFIDVPIIRGFRENDWVGLGMFYQYDQQRYDDVNLITNKIFGGISYHFALDKKLKNILSLGVQSGNANVYFSSPNITTYSEFGDNPREDPAEAALPIKNPQGNNGTSSTGRTNWVGGVHFKSNISKNQQLSLGFAMANIGRINNSILGSGGFSKKPLRYIFHAQYMMPIADKINLEPRLFFQFQDPSWDMSLQTMAHFLLNEEKGNTIGGGLGYNIKNGLQLLVNAHFKNLRVGYSFDLNLSDKTVVSGPAAAFELGVSYILKFYKKPNPDPVLVCPRL